MRLVWLWVMLLILASECYGCLEHERVALLQLKAYSIKHSNVLPMWVEAWEGETTTDCCKWERVKCNATTGRVIQLSLNSAENYHYSYSRDWYLNASMFLPFEELESLDLSCNGLAGWLENEGFERLGELTSLTSLNLSYNNLEGTIHINDLKGLNNVEQLDISYNQLDGFITHSGFERLSVLGKLELLRLDGNSFNNSILPYLGVLSSLKTLSLAANPLNESIDIGEFCNMNLKELDLSDNFIEDIKDGGDLKRKLIFAGFERLSVLGQLELLRLDWNSFNNSILPSLGVLSSLKTLSLHGNLLNGSIDIGEFCNMNNLKVLDLSENSIEDIKDGGDLKRKLIFAGFERLSVLGKLELLRLDWNSVNNSILPSLGVLSSLKTLSLSENRLNGSIDIGENPTCEENLFRRRFQMRRSLYLQIVDAVKACDNFFVQKKAGLGRLGLSTLQKVTSAFRMLAYGMAADSTDEYIRIGESTTILCIKKFCRAIVDIFGKKYLRSPNSNDIASLFKKGEKRGLPGMLGSLDCIHCSWKNCPTAWAGQYSGRGGSPTIILEAVASHDLWIWRA
ncbi:receptor-like protein 9a [Camellia sinensis]|uniref:receptor-like protein 9a n=1 Tax=Camellia sinensis TaxID=4442 RepID=UPI0010362A4F|nr:receptor-like protein 9a [Camellia sinensis]